jgi:hypothetical protein
MKSDSTPVVLNLWVEAQKWVAGNILMGCVVKQSHNIPMEAQGGEDV